MADLHDAFEQCDMDGDGRIGIQEFADLLQNAGSLLNDSQRDSEFKRIDTDGDGRIELAEFKLWWSAR
jgi:Ca2+-binding EF-hand superfamily protein